VPGEVGAATRALSEERRAIDGHLVAHRRAHDPLEDRVLQPGAEDGVAFELLDLPVAVARPDPSLAEPEVHVTPGRRVVLEEEPLVDDSPEHDVLGARTERIQLRVAGHATEPRPPVLPPVREDVRKVGQPSLLRHRT
jgi:hypothetical protein